MIENKDLKKTIGIVLIVLFLFSGFTASIISKRTLDYSDNTLYVGGSGLGNYSTIQAAVDNASDGDTVFVYAGVYNESVTFNKSLSLIGEHRTDTIINGVDSSDFATLFLTGNDSSIQRFTIGEGEGKCRTGIYLWGSSNNSISHCTFLMDSSGHPGVYAMEINHDSCDNIIKDCSVFSKFKGINIGGGSDRNQIVNCDFTIPGISEDGVSGDDSIKIWDGCYDNVIVNCSMVGGNGIMVWGSNTRVSNCVIRDTIGNNGFNLGYCMNNTLRNNTLLNCTLYVFFNEQSQLYHDIDTSNTINGKPIYYLIGEDNFSVDESWNVGYLGLISCNNVTVKHVNSQGIFIGDSSNIIITGCMIHHAQSLSVFSSEQINIANCSVTSSHYGVDINLYSSNIAISDCSINGGISGIGVDLYCENVQVSHCNISACHISGIGIGGKGNVVDNVSVFDSEYWGIGVSNTENQVTHCLVVNNSIGLGVEGEKNQLMYNNVIDNTHGIFCQSGSNNFIHHNNFIDNRYNANTSNPNKWFANYWDDWVGLKNPWLGFFPYHVSITYSQELVRTFLHSFDWHPADEPYEV